MTFTEYFPVPSKRFVYDLSAALGDLAAHGRFPPNDPTPKAWLVEHLRSYHQLEVDDLYPLTRRSDIRLIDERCPRVAQALTKSLYRMFRPMAFLAMEAHLTDMSLRHDQLTVTLYDVYPDRERP